ncbi:MAG: hypothetical protein HY744_11280 [Deltaproteobacteria bacterium]|nr:hypothetical protein [Deltaproteobacteria bacterium]
MATLSEETLVRLEREHEGGLSSADLLGLLADAGIRFGEATLHKWVQLGLLPRSVRVGRKGKHQGSRGLYPVRVVRQILRVKDMMARGLTIEEIQRHFLFVRGDLEHLDQTLAKIFDILERLRRERADSMTAHAVASDLSRARQLARELVARLESIERRLSAAGPSAERTRAVLAS